MECIAYKGGYKYQLTEQYTVTIPIIPEGAIETDYISLDMNGLLIIKKGYAWDGPSGLAPDTRNFMRASLVHDALYQLMRYQVLDRTQYRKRSDKLLQTMCKEDEMNPIFAWFAYILVRIGGDQAAHYENKKKVIRAPSACEQAINR